MVFCRRKYHIIKENDFIYGIKEMKRRQICAELLDLPVRFR